MSKKDSQTEDKRKRPTLKKETLRDLGVRDKSAERMKGGAVPETKEGCPTGTYSCRK
jgi:hypothetical protein